MRRIVGLVCVLVGMWGTRAEAWVSPVPDVVVYTQRSLGLAMRDVGARFLAERHVRVHVFVNSSDGLAGLISRGARADVVVADRATIDALGALGAPGALGAQAVPGSRTVIGEDVAVLVARADAGIAHGDAAALVAAHPVVVTDPTSAASFDGRAALRGFAPGVVPMGVADAPDVVFAVAHGPASHDMARIGLVHGSSLVGQHDVAVVGSPPVPPLRIEAATLTGGQSREQAVFVAFLASAPMLAALRADGLEAVR